jgi:hypothetical protein
MYRSCPLIQHFAQQGLKIRVRKESTPRGSRVSFVKTQEEDESPSPVSAEDQLPCENEHDEKSFSNLTHTFKLIKPIGRSRYTPSLPKPQGYGDYKSVEVNDKVSKFDTIRKNYEPLDKDRYSNGPEGMTLYYWIGY